jgi:hypothetical protein
MSSTLGRFRVQCMHTAAGFRGKTPEAGLSDVFRVRCAGAESGSKGIELILRFRTYKYDRGSGRAAPAGHS